MDLFYKIPLLQIQKSLHYGYYNTGNGGNKSGKQNIPNQSLLNTSRV